MSKEFASRKTNSQQNVEARNPFAPRQFAPAPTPQVQAKSDETKPNLELRKNIPSSDRLSRIEITPPNPIQPKLTIGAPNDKYEREADTVARKVVSEMNSVQTKSASAGNLIQPKKAFRAPETPLRIVGESIQPKISIRPKSTVQRSETEASSELESSIKQARGSGQSLSENVREPMERAFGADFGGVRIHTNSESNKLNQSIQAKAFTTGGDIFFRQGEYQPSSRGGQELLAHELTHVVQQGGSTVQQKTEPRIQRLIYDNNNKQVVNRKWAKIYLKTKGIDEDIATQLVNRYASPAANENKTLDELVSLGQTQMQQQVQAQANPPDDVAVVTENSNGNGAAPEQAADNTQNEQEPAAAIGKIPEPNIKDLADALAHAEKYIPESLTDVKSEPSPVTEDEWAEDQAEWERKLFYEMLDSVLDQYRHSISVSSSDSEWESDDDDDESIIVPQPLVSADDSGSDNNEVVDNQEASMSESDDATESNTETTESQVPQVSPQASVPNLQDFQRQTTRKLLGIKAKRGVYTQAIDNWILAVNNAEAAGKEPPLQDLLDACEAWLDHHKNDTSATITQRKPVIVDLADGLKMLLPAIKTELKVPKASQLDGTSDVASEATGVATEWGQTGNIVDVGTAKDCGNTSDIDVVEGLNVLSGAINFSNALQNENKVEAILQAADGVGKTAHGLGKLTKGILIKAKEVEDLETSAEAAAYNDYTAIGDVGAGVSDCLSMACQTYELYKQLKSGQFQEDTLTTAKTALGTVDSALNTTKDILKAIQEFENNTQFSSAVSGLAQTSGCLTAALSAIEGIQQAAQYAKAAKDNTAIQEAIARIEQQQEQAQQNLNEFGAQLNSALKAKQKINNLTMDTNDNLIKGTKVVAGIASGVLLASGFGAPIVLPFVVIGAIAGLGYAGLKLGRNKAAGTAMNIAQRLTNQGKPKGKVDEIDYRTMEQRMFNCYYNHLSEVIKPNGENPSGMSTDDFTAVKYFAWEDKKVRVPSEKKEVIETELGSAWGQVDGLDNTVKRNNWVEVHISDNNDTIYKEKPKKLAKVGLKLSPSAHKSGAAKEANINDIVNAVYVIGSQSFDPNQNVFKPCPIIGVGNPANAENVPNNVNSVELLTTLKIDANKWKSWLEESQGSDATQIDETQLKAKIKNYVK